jgi:diacylglycerol kinase family enzyme
VVRALLVINPQATSTTPGGREVLAHALASEVKLDLLETEHRGHAASEAAAALTEGVDLVIVHGGDGTVNEVVNGLLRHGPSGDVPALGIVPGGSANVFARALGLPREPLEAVHRLLAAIDRRSRRTVSLGQAGGHWFCFNAGLGWDADVVAEVGRRRRKQAGRSLYTRLALREYAAQYLRRPALRVQLPGEDGCALARALFVSNGDPWTYLGRTPIRLNPGCSFDAGLGILALRSLSVPSVLSTVARAVLGRCGPAGSGALRDDDVGELRAHSNRPVRLQVDGDLLGRHTDVTFRNVPNALSVIV